MCDLSNPETKKLRRIDRSRTSAYFILQNMRHSSSTMSDTEIVADSDYGIALCYDKYGAYGVTANADPNAPVLWFEKLTIPYDNLIDNPKQLESIISSAGYPEYDNWFQLLWDIVSYGYFDRMEPSSMWDNEPKCYAIFDKGGYEPERWKQFDKGAYSPEKTKEFYKGFNGNVGQFLKLTVVEYEYEYRGQWYDVAIQYDDRLVLIDLIPRYPGRGIPHKSKLVTLRKIRQCRDKVQLILVEPDNRVNMEGQIARALLTGESGRIRQTKREKQIRQKKSNDVR